MRLRLTRKPLQLPLDFFSSSPLLFVTVFTSVLSFVTQEACSQYRTCFIGHTKKGCLDIVP